MDPHGKVERLQLPAGLPTLPSETRSLAQNQNEIELLQHFAKTKGVEWTVLHAHLVLHEARGLGDV